MNKLDWTGNKQTAYSIIGASNHSNTKRSEHDYYATDPKATELLLENETFSNNVWECATGEGHISKVLESHGYNVRSTDLIYRGYGEATTLDFLQINDIQFDGDIITNPPYKYAKEFVEKALEIITDSRKVAMFLKLTFLESKSRKPLFKKYPPKTVYVSSTRLLCAKNGDFNSSSSSAIAYAWFVWEKGFTGDPIIKWIN